MRRPYAVLFTVAALALAGPALADKGGKDKDKGKGKEHAAAEHAPGHGWGRAFSGSERDEIVRWFDANPGARSQLPPGLAKKNKIPPGWQKKVGKGQRIPDDIWLHRVPLPHEILAKLPPPPPGVVLVRIHDRVLKVVEKTHEVLDDLGLPHPPTPPRLP
jgi:hypothetical protein